jgi:hypothetical protein
MATPPPSTIDSRQGPGTLTIGDTAPAMISVEYQAATVKLTPTANSEDGTPTLAVPEPAPNTSIDWALNVSAIQDFEDPAGFVNFLMDNALAELPFEWAPNGAAGAPVWSGVVQIVPIEIGGDVGVQVVTDVELPCVGTPTRDDSGLAPLTSRSSSSKKAAAE